MLALRGLHPEQAQLHLPAALAPLSLPASPAGGFPEAVPGDGGCPGVPKPGGSSCQPLAEPCCVQLTWCLLWWLEKVAECLPDNIRLDSDLRMRKMPWVVLFCAVSVLVDCTQTLPWEPQICADAADTSEK